MTKKIKGMARIAYFGTETHNRYGLEGFTDGFEKGYQRALCDVKRAMADEPNNLQKIGAIYKLIKEVDNGF